MAGLSPVQITDIMTTLNDMFERQTDPRDIRAYIDATVRGKALRKYLQGMSDDALRTLVASQARKPKKLKFERAKLSPEVKRDLVRWYMVPNAISNGLRAAGTIAANAITKNSEMARALTEGQGSTVLSTRDPMAAAADAAAVGKSKDAQNVMAAADAVANVVGQTANARNAMQNLEQQRKDLETVSEYGGGLPTNSVFDFFGRYGSFRP